MALLEFFLPPLAMTRNQTHVSRIVPLLRDLNPGCLTDKATMTATEQMFNWSNCTVIELSIDWMVDSSKGSTDEMVNQSMANWSNNQTMSLLFNLLNEVHLPNMRSLDLSEELIESKFLGPRGQSSKVEELENVARGAFNCNLRSPPP